MCRVSVAFQRFSLVCLLALVCSAVQALGIGPFGGLEGDPPNWATSLLLWIFLTNSTAAILTEWRGLTSGVAGVLAFAGLTTIISGGILRAFGAGLRLPAVIVIAYLAGWSLAAIGIWRFDPRKLRTEFSSRSHAVIGLGIGVSVLVGELIFEAVSTVIWLLPVLWVTEVGFMLIPLVVLTSLRWLRTAGIHTDDTLGVRLRKYSGIHWDCRAMIRLETNPQFVRAGCIVAATIGALVVLLTPTVEYVADTSLSRGHTLKWCSPTWAEELNYDADWSAIHLRWPDGCNGQSAFVNWQYGVVGILLGVAGVVGERITAIWD